MKKLAICALTASGLLALAACGSQDAPSAPEGTTVEQGEDWTAKPDEGVDVTLPETPVTDENVPATEESSETAPAE
ncbi:hypothetical protein MB02_01770 [Croceicoccus estronivorus]|uniref:hypothetical protein n=1 Tax=Croceicoccus estronivorus TaxID=1172626 RepID=UPI0008365C03|nr:hypothetical protein [Croceicoccus estronivorus]OCC25406.1 hypothetical protein MB02_01770 [Croceicoccus estronivorus]